MEGDVPESGLFASLGRMAATLIALVHTRLELASTELEEQLEYAGSVLLWSIAAIFCASLTVLLLALTVIVAFWDSHRLLAAGAVTGAFALIALVAFGAVRRLLGRRPQFFAATTEELRRDVAALRGEPR
jgi:uncharacterized membrane protein YqjE